MPKSAAALRARWGAWTGRSVDLPVPPHWRIVDLDIADAPGLSAVQIDDALEAPLGAPRIAELARTADRIAVAIDDITRPTPTAPVVERLVARLEDCGVDLDRITVIVATGAHREATRDDMWRKLGPVAERVRVISHDPVLGLTDTGVTLAGTPLRVNRLFLEADLRIGICGVMPHPFAGSSGGGKIVLPGLADLDVVVRSHKYALLGAPKMDLEQNRFRKDMEAAVRAIGLQWSVNVAMNSRCEPAALYAGDFVTAHRAASKAANTIGRTTPPDLPLDALVINAFPKDSELLQIEAALVPLREGLASWLHPAAPVVLLGACPDGVGSHQLFGPGGRLYSQPKAKPYLSGRPLHIVSPATKADEQHEVFWDGYEYHETWAACAHALVTSLPKFPVVGYAPVGTLHVPATAATNAGNPLPAAEVLQ